MNKKSFTFRIEQEIYDKLRKTAFDKNIKMAEIIRQAIIKFLNKSI